MSPGRESANRSDSIMLLHTDPSRGRLAYLSIPRDLQVEIPDYGLAKINAASQVGGPALALRTVKDLTGLPVNHVVFVDFARFAELIDAVGGIDIVVPRPIQSKRFDCPYKTAARCEAWPGWRFEKGPQHMDGRRALVYSRIRVNELNPSETDFDRTRRQQQVVQATLDKATGVGTALRLPFVGDDPRRAALDRPQRLGSSSSSAGRTSRADTGKALHCRLGGDPATVGGESVILGSEDNVATVAMFTGRSVAARTAEGPALRAGLPGREARTASEARVSRSRTSSAADRSSPRASSDFDSFFSDESPELPAPPPSPSLPVAFRPPRP